MKCLRKRSRLFTWTPATGGTSHPFSPLSTSRLLQSAAPGAELARAARTRVPRCARGRGRRQRRVAAPSGGLLVPAVLATAVRPSRAAAGDCACAAMRYAPPTPAQRSCTRNHAQATRTCRRPPCSCIAFDTLSATGARPHSPPATRAPLTSRAPQAATYTRRANAAARDHRRGSPILHPARIARALLQ
jgi:hypothetical protein